MIMLKGIIYKYTSPSEKVYIGQTYNEKCRKQNFKCLSSSYGSPKIDNARRKYGPENFQYEILFSIETEDKELLMNELNSKEQYFIEQFDSINNGYNVLRGGSVYHEYIYSKEDREKIGAVFAKPIIQYDLEGNVIAKWPSASEAGRVLGIQSALISKCCNRATSHCRDFIFRFEGDVVLDEEKNPKQHKTKNLKVLQINGEEIVNSWKSVAQASKALGIERHKLSNLLKQGPFTFIDSVICFEEINVTGG